ncbi:MAG: hypothetical protein ABEJ30_05735 [Halorientalis sp.]
MFDCSAVTAALAAPEADPRLNEAFVRCLPGTGDRGTVLVAGVVHDHPASVYRVAHLLRTVSPDYLALELPPLALPLFDLYARDRQMPPHLGGEMSVAIQAADRATTVGINGPTGRYLRLLADRLRADRPSRSVLRRVLRDVVGGAAHALACRLAAALGAVTPVRLRVYARVEHETSWLDPPSVQADDEAAHFSQHQTFLRAITVPESTRLVDEARETVMVEKLRDLRARGDVVAVVGMDHLEAVATELERAG